MSVQRREAPVRTGRRAALITVAVNLAVGGPAVVPWWLLRVGLSNWPLAELGSTVREPTEDDGILSWQVVGPPVVATATLLWWLLNSALRSRLAAEAPRSWLLSTAAVLAPAAALFTDSPT